jgi:hypothetical protein
MSEKPASPWGNVKHPQRELPVESWAYFVENKCVMG